MDTLDPAMDVSAVHFQSLDMFGPRVGFLKFRATATCNGKPVPGIVFMRGGAVAILVLLRCGGEEHALLCRQPRMPIGRTRFPEIPAGMLDGSGHFAGVAAKEMEEETGLTMAATDLVDLTELAYKGAYKGVYPSGGGCDEFLRLFLYRKDVSREELTALQGKLTGSAEEHEHIVLEVVPYDALWTTTSDAKSLAAVLLYERLKASGAIPK